MDGLTSTKSAIIKAEEEEEEGEEEEPMDTTELLYDDFDEEGEIHSSEDERNDSEPFRKKEASSEGNVRGSAPFRSFMTGANAFDNKTEDLKKMERAKRFAIPLEKSVPEPVNNESLGQLHRTLGIDKENERHYRFNAVHMRGTQDMSTEDVLDYFASFAPSSIEWINDVSCNVVWADDISAARALLNISKEIKNLDKIHLNADPFRKKSKEEAEAEFESVVDGDAVDARDIDAAIPPGFWRIGAETKKSNAILLRFATRSDRKQKNAEKNSEYYKRYGNPHFGNIPGLVSKSLRSGVFKKYRRNASRDRNGAHDEDDGGDRSGRKNPWGHLAQEWSEQDQILSKQSERSIKSRISLKRQHPRPVADLRLSINNKQRRSKYLEAKQSEGVRNSSRSSSSEEEDNRVKFPRMKMYADEEEKAAESCVQRRLALNRIVPRPKAPVFEDLRNKIDRKIRSRKLLNTYYKRDYSRTQYDSSEEEEDDDGELDDEKDSGWALEQYADLRESLQNNKKNRSSHRKKTAYKSESEENEEGTRDDSYGGNLGHRSPLQIEIENDEYFENESVSTL